MSKTLCTQPSGDRNKCGIVSIKSLSAVYIVVA